MHKVSPGLVKASAPRIIASSTYPVCLAFAFLGLDYYQGHEPPKNGTLV